MQALKPKQLIWGIFVQLVLENDRHSLAPLGWALVLCNPADSEDFPLGNKKWLHGQAMKVGG